MIPVSANTFDPKVIIDIQNVIKSGILTRGPYSRKLETKLKQFTGHDTVYSVSSGTAALHVAVLACGIKPGDEVLVPSLTYVSSASVILMEKATPVFVDVDKQTFCIDIDDVIAKITDKTKAIIAVDFAGRSCDHRRLAEVAKTHGLKLICDAAHSFGCYLPEHSVDQYCDYLCYSFYPTKPLASSEGGALVVNDPQANHEKINTIINNGVTPTPDSDNLYDSCMLGFKYNMNELSAVIALSEMDGVMEKIAKRKALFTAYQAGLSDIEGIRMQQIEPTTAHSHHILPISLDFAQDQSLRKVFREYLQQSRIQTSIHYRPIHTMKLYNKGEILKNTSFLGQRIVSLPLQDKMSLEDVNNICSIIRNFRKEIL